MANNKNGNKVWGEIKDLLTGAAFPLMLQLIFSASIIIFADYGDDLGIQIVCLVVGELLLGAAYVIFGRQNGISAYRRTVQGEKKRALDPFDETAKLRIGEYALWKAFAIGVISCIPYALFQFIECLAHNDVCTFVLKYAFGWAVYPFEVIGGVSSWLNFIWIIVPVAIHAAAYIWGASLEKKRQSQVEKAQELKDKRRK